MKNVTPFIICKLLLNIALCYTMLLFSSRNLYAKPCQDLFISEILFGIEMPHMPGVINHAIEIYNPTDGNISLSGYSIIFTTVNGISVPINLNGVILAKSTFVISNSQAFLPIISVSGQFSPYLDFQNVTVISLIKNGLGILDKIGNEGPGIPLDEIDIDQLQNPEYLENINIRVDAI